MAKPSLRTRVRNAARGIVWHYRPNLCVTRKASVHEDKALGGWWVDAQIFVPAHELPEWENWNEEEG